MDLPAPRPVPALHRWIAYGLTGFCIEVAFTALSDAIGQRNRTLRGETYLWMFPIYGAGGLLLEGLHRLLAPRVPRPVRALAYVGAIYATEYATGLALRKTIGVCPWDYGARGLNVHGLVRLDFAPFWYACAIAFEPASAYFRRALSAGWTGGSPLVVTGVNQPSACSPMTLSS